MKECDYCGRENDDQATHCVECGTTGFKTDAPTKKRERPRASADTSMVLLTRCRTIQEADIVVSRLQASGISTMVPDESLMQNVPFNVAYGFVRVLVSSADYLAARRLLADSNDEVTGVTRPPGTASRPLPTFGCRSPLNGATSRESKATPRVPIRPVAIGFVAIAGLIVHFLWLPLPLGQPVGTGPLLHMLCSALLGMVCMYGFWKMWRWSVLVYAALSMIDLLYYWVLLWRRPHRTYSPAVEIVIALVGVYYYRRMR